MNYRLIFGFRRLRALSLSIALIHVALGPACSGFAEAAQRKIYFYHMDHLGSPTIVTDAQGAIVEQTEHLPYGAVARHTGSLTTPHKFTGQRLDADTGLYFYNARYYDPQLGRFISPDTFVPAPGDPQSLNRYSYVRDNPVKFTDPSGNFFWIPFIIGIAKIAAVASIAATAAGFTAAGTGHPHAANTFFKAAGFAGAVGALAGGFTFFNATTSMLLVTSTALSFGRSESARAASAILGWTALGMQVGQGVYNYATSHADIVFPDGSPVQSLDEAHGFGINGIMTDRAGAQGFANQIHSPVLRNPSTSPISDLVESGLQKVFGGSSLARQASDAMLDMVGSGQPLHLYFHSQGTIIGTNALFRFAHLGGALPLGSTAQFGGPAVGYGRALTAFLKAGGNFDNFRYLVNPFDPVPAMTATLNPIRMVVGTVSGVLTVGRFHQTDVYWGDRR